MFSTTDREPGHLIRLFDGMLPDFKAARKRRGSMSGSLDRRSEKVDRTIQFRRCLRLSVDRRRVGPSQDLALHDASHDSRTPTHELTIARDVLRTRPRIAAHPPNWALSHEGLRSLRGEDRAVGAAAPAVGAAAADVVERDVAPDGEGDGGILLPCPQGDGAAFNPCVPIFERINGRQASGRSVKDTVSVWEGAGPRNDTIITMFVKKMSLRYID